MPVRFEWDDAKAAANLGKHGLPFDEAVAVFADSHRTIIATSRTEDGEDRQKAAGAIGGRLFTVVFVMRGDVCRIISARRANAKEERAHGSNDAGFG